MATPMAGAAAKSPAPAFLFFYFIDAVRGAYENRIETIGIRIRKQVRK
ncbi:hypothetical protein MKD50_17445 [Cupriavidus sp. WGtm5]|nr:MULTISPECIES: hypothetical protein [Cupriavidus]MCO4891169.1 hypothetical protein [Cupriavidus sp. WGtm5]